MQHGLPKARERAADENEENDSTWTLNNKPMPEIVESVSSEAGPGIITQVDN